MAFAEARAFQQATAIATGTYWMSAVYAAVRASQRETAIAMATSWMSAVYVAVRASQKVRVTATGILLRTATIATATA